MQTLPTPMSQTKALSLADVANQNNTHVKANKSSAENAKLSFQAELNKQVRAKQNQVQTKQDKSVETVSTQPQQKVSVKDQSESDQDSSKISQALGADQSENTFLSDLNKQLEASRDLSGKVSLGEFGDVTQEKDATLLAGNQSAVSAFGIASSQQVQTNSNVVQTALQTETKNILADSTTLAAASKSSPATFSASTTKTEPNLAEAHLRVDDSTVKASTEAQVDFAAVKTESKPFADELALNKSMLNLATKELPVKDAAPQTIQAPSTVTSAVQNNTNLAAQQLGSSNFINVYPGKSGWDQAISQKVVWMVGSGQQSASITLNPPDLGPLKVVINVHNDQADTTFISDNDEVRKALEAGMSHLRDKMNETGIQLGQANVSTSQQSQQEFQQSAQGRGLQNVKNQTSAEASSGHAKKNVTIRVSDGLVDTFA